MILKNQFRFLLPLLLMFSTVGWANSVSTVKLRLSKMTEQECSKLKAAGESGPAEQQALLAAAYENGACGLTKDPVQAAMLYRVAAAQGNTTAELGLADLYMRGEGLSKNELQAVTWIRKAADAGDGDAQAELGKAYEEGSGVPKDIQQAMQWYQKGALAGNAESQYRLGLVYRNGLIGPRDYEEAIKWLQRAADNDHFTAMAVLGRLYMERTNPGETAQILPLIKKAAEAGDAFGQFEYGELFAHGIAGAPKNPGLARSWYEKSAAQGYSQAQETVRDLDKMNAIRARDADQPAVPTGGSIPRVDRTIPPQALSLTKLGLEIKIYDSSQKWSAQEINSTDVLISTKGTKIAVSLVEDVPCKTKTEMFSPTVVPNRNYIPSGWYKNAGEQYSSGNYVGDLCFHYATGLVSAMIVSSDKWDGPVYRTVIPALDAVRVAVVERWGEDHSEAVSDLVPFPPASAVIPQTQPSAPQVKTPGYSLKFKVMGMDLTVQDPSQWQATSVEGQELLLNVETGLQLNFVESPIPNCSEVMKRLGGSLSNTYAPGWFRTARSVSQPGSNAVTVCIDFKAKSLLATLASTKDLENSAFRSASNLLSSVASKLEEKLGRR